MSEANGLPKGWVRANLPDSILLNPPKVTLTVSADTSITFVPMPAVTEEFGGINVSQTRPLKEVQKGYTQFTDGDVLFAKITPCMENGKIAIVPRLEHGLGYGSTEFHVLRPRDGVDAKWIAHFLSQHTLRRDARRNMTGSAGQLRVPMRWLEELRVPIAPLNEQRRIVEKIEELFSDLDAGVAALERAKANLKRYRASVVKAAVEGKLTAAWRTEHKGVEPASKLLERILAERRRRWEADQLAKFAAAGKSPPKNWRDKYAEPAPPDTANLPELPKGWCWATMGQLIVDGPQNGAYYPKSLYGSGVPIVRIDDYQQFWNRGSDALQRVQISEGDQRTYGLQINDLVINRVNSVTHLGKVMLVESKHVPAIFESNMMRMRVAGDCVPAYIRDYLRSSSGKLRLTENAKWAVNQASINQQDVANTPIPFPPKDEQSQIVADVAERLSQIEAAEVPIDNGLHRAARLRQSILKRAFEGKLVPQDPRDEPASVLLERIKAKQPAHGDLHEKAERATARRKVRAKRSRKGATADAK